MLGTAAQIVPAITPKVNHLTQIVRTQHWVFPGHNFKYNAFLQWIFKYVPFALAMHRFHIFILAEKDFGLFYMNSLGAMMRKMKRSSVERFMREAAPAKYHDILIPDFDVGCKASISEPGR
jgi:cation diffusion facilitator CzcD-associated flavoprotein CzcO